MVLPRHTQETSASCPGLHRPHGSAAVVQTLQSHPHADAGGYSEWQNAGPGAPTRRKEMRH